MAADAPSPRGRAVAPGDLPGLLDRFRSGERRALARLLTQVAPSVFVDDTFALKGGTAINLFYRDLPRLSVDLDLVFPDHSLPRPQSSA